MFEVNLILLLQNRRCRCYVLNEKDLWDCALPSVSKLTKKFEIRKARHALSRRVETAETTQRWVGKGRQTQGDWLFSGDLAVHQRLQKGVEWRRELILMDLKVNLGWMCRCNGPIATGTRWFELFRTKLWDFLCDVESLVAARQIQLGKWTPYARERCRQRRVRVRIVNWYILLVLATPQLLPARWLLW